MILQIKESRSLDFTATCEIYVVSAVRPAGLLCQSLLESRCLQMKHTHTVSLADVLRITSPLTVTHEKIFFSPIMEKKKLGAA